MFGKRIPVNNRFYLIPLSLSLDGFVISSAFARWQSSAEYYVGNLHQRLCRQRYIKSVIAQRIETERDIPWCNTYVSRDYLPYLLLNITITKSVYIHVMSVQLFINVKLKQNILIVILLNWTNIAGEGYLRRLYVKAGITHALIPVGGSETSLSHSTAAAQAAGSRHRKRKREWSMTNTYFL